VTCIDSGISSDKIKAISKEKGGKKMQKKKVKKFNVKHSILLLLLLAVFLILSSYAWFTSNTLVKIDTIDVSVATSSGFQISVDAVNWKSVLAVDDIIKNNIWTTNTNHIPAGTTMAPVSTVGDTNADGTLKMFLGQVISDPVTGQPVLTTNDSADASANTTYIAFDVFLKTNQQVDLNLDVSANVIGGRNSANDTKGLENAVRVGFVNEGNLDFSEYQASTGVADARALKAANQVIFWEPNSNSHTPQAIADALNTYGVTLGANEVVGPYSAVKDTTPIDVYIPLSESKVSSTDYGTYFGELDATAVPGQNCILIQTPKPTGTGATGVGDGTLPATQPLGITLQPGVTKVRIYMWIEGQDYDCQDFASGTNLQFNLAFTV